MNYLLIFLGGGLGSVLRYGLSNWLVVEAEGEPSLFPWATLAANLLASMLLGLGLAYFSRELLTDAQRLLLLTGFCGGFSTFSTLSWELVRLWANGHWTTASLYLLLSLTAGLAAIWLGWKLGGGNSIS